MYTSLHDLNRKNKYKLQDKKEDQSFALRTLQKFNGKLVEKRIKKGRHDFGTFFSLPLGLLCQEKLCKATDSLVSSLVLTS